MNIGPTGTAIVRTVVPFIVGFVVAVLAKAGLSIDSTALETALVPVVGGLYYAGVLWLQKNVNPNFGWLLGSPALPGYDNGKVVEGEVVSATPVEGIEDDLRTEDDLRERVEFSEADDPEIFDGQAPIDPSESE